MPGDDKHSCSIIYKGVSGHLDPVLQLRKGWSHYAFSYNGEYRSETPYCMWTNSSKFKSHQLLHR